MVYNPVQYVRYNTYGNTAKKPVHIPVLQKAILPKFPAKKRRTICVDPISLLSIAVAICLMVTMTIGIVKFVSVRQEAAQMEKYVHELSSRNRELTEQYQSGYDLQQIEKSALALGMVSRDQVQTVSIEIEMPQQEQAVSLWEQFGTFLTSLFA